MIEAFIKLHEKGLIYQGIVLLLVELFFFFSPKGKRGVGIHILTFLILFTRLNQFIGAKEQGAACFQFVNLTVQGILLFRILNI